MRPSFPDTLGFEELWHQAIKQNGEDRQGAAVIELTELVNLSGWPPGTRLIATEAVNGR